MKLLHVIGSMDPNTGGPCQTIRNFAPWFLEQGNELEVVCLDDPHSPYLSDKSFKIHALGKGRGSWNYEPELLPWLNENLANYDAAILNGLWQYQGYALWKAARRIKKTPYHIFPHGMLDPWFQKISVRPMKAIRNWLVWKLFQNRIVHDATGLLFTCEEERRLAQKPFRPYAPKRESVVGLGVPEPPKYQDGMKQAFLEKCPKLAGGKNFLFLSRIHPKKGVDLLIRAYAESCKLSGGTPLPTLVIAGPGLETSFGREMQMLAAQLCPAGKVLWPGMLAGDAKWGALYGCEASVLPSHQENFGITVVETLACGRPVMISDQVNIWREIQECEAAFVEKDSVAGTKKNFQDWMNLSNEDRSKMGSQARLCFQKYFSIQSATRKLLVALAIKA